MEPQGGPLAGAPSFMVVRACGESHAVNGPAQRVSQSAYGPPARASYCGVLALRAWASQQSQASRVAAVPAWAGSVWPPLITAVSWRPWRAPVRRDSRDKWTGRGAPCLHARQATCRASPGNPSRNLLHLAVSGMGPFPRHAARVSLRTTSPRGEESPCLPGRAISLLRDSSCSRLS